MFKTKNEKCDTVNGAAADSGEPAGQNRSGKDVLSHLLDVENSVANFVLEAQTEADKRISAAKEDAENEYKREYGKLISEFEAEFLKEKEAEDRKLEKIYKEFDEELFSKEKDYKRFCSYLDKCFPGA